MVRRRGPRLTAAQKAELWWRWRQGGCFRNQVLVAAR